MAFIHAWTKKNSDKMAVGQKKVALFLLEKKQHFYVEIFEIIIEVFISMLTVSN